MIDYYKELGVKSNATKQEIKLAYLSLLKKYHPDVYDGNPKVAQDKTALLNECYDVLKDDEKRAQYDQKLFANTPNQNQKSPDDFILREFFRRFRVNNVNTNTQKTQTQNQNFSQKQNQQQKQNQPKKQTIQKEKKEKQEKTVKKEKIKPIKQEVKQEQIEDIDEIERKENKKLTIYIFIIFVDIIAIVLVSIL